MNRLATPADSNTIWRLSDDLSCTPVLANRYAIRHPSAAAQHLTGSKTRMLAISELHALTKYSAAQELVTSRDDSRAAPDSRDWQRRLAHGEHLCISAFALHRQLEEEAEGTQATEPLAQLQKATLCPSKHSKLRMLSFPDCVYEAQWHSLRQQQYGGEESPVLQWRGQVRLECCMQRNSAFVLCCRGRTLFLLESISNRGVASPACSPGHFGVHADRFQENKGQMTPSTFSKQLTIRPSHCAC